MKAAGARIPKFGKFALTMDLDEVPWPRPAEGMGRMGGKGSPEVDQRKTAGNWWRSAFLPTAVGYTWASSGSRCTISKRLVTEPHVRFREVGDGFRGMVVAKSCCNVVCVIDVKFFRKCGLLALQLPKIGCPLDSFGSVFRKVGEPWQDVMPCSACTKP